MRNNDDVADAVAGFVMFVVVAAIVAVAILAARMLTEVIRINVERGQPDCPIAGQLRQALVALVAALAASSVLMMLPATAGIGAALAAWSFLAYAIYIEGLDSRLARQERDGLEDLASYLTVGGPHATSGTDSRAPMVG